jgi:putative sigma-54 modulation protein
MDIHLHAKNFEITARVRDYAERKLSRLDKYLPNIARVDMELAEEHPKHSDQRASAQITVRHSRGTILRAEDKSQADVFAAIDIALDKMYRQISRYKGKRQHRLTERTGLDSTLYVDEFDEAEALPVTGDEQSAGEGEIVRRKQIEIGPMSEEEAIDQMELLGHDFFVFFNAATNKVNVLYRRKQGNLGLIDPIFGK